MDGGFESGSQGLEGFRSGCDEKPCSFRFRKRMEALLKSLPLSPFVPLGLEFVERVYQYENVVGSFMGQLTHRIFQESRKRLMGGLCVLVVFMLLVFDFDAFWDILFELPQDLSQQQSGDIFRSLVFYRMIENEVQNSEARGAFELIKDDGADALKTPAGREYTQDTIFLLPLRRCR